MSDKAHFEQECRDFAYVNMVKDYYRFSTDAPTSFGEIMGIQLLGHAMGREPINLIQPKARFHNLYTCLVGESTLSRKSTSQDLAKDIYPRRRWLPTETSPESLIEKLSHMELNEGFWWMGEFTRLLKGINSGGYMAGFAELLNDLSGCSPLSRMLRSKKGEETEFNVETPYLDISTTTTPEALKLHLTSELAHGGFLPRWLLVYGKPQTKPRGLLSEDALKLNETLRNHTGQFLELSKTACGFVLTEEALKHYNTYENEMLARERVKPFAGRYSDYMISIADILLVSDAIGVAIAQCRSIGSFSNLVDLVDVLDLVEKKEETSLPSPIKPTNPTKLLSVPSGYIDRAYQIVKPCLAYAETLVQYVDLDKIVAKFLDYLRKQPNGEAQRYKVLQFANITAKQADDAADTLQSANLIDVIHDSDPDPTKSIVQRKRGCVYKLRENPESL